MKIIECSPFFNEHIIGEIHIREASKWIDEFHLTECNRTFKGGIKEYCFNANNNSGFLHYHKLDGDKQFKKFRKFPHIEMPKISRSLPGYIYRDPSWRNDACQRNYALWNCDYSDDDILILSDIDEVIDSQYADLIIETTKKHGIATIKIHFTNFYFNLFCHGFSGPADYSYRIFIVRGDIMRKTFKNDSDYLRKLGESGALIEEVYCFPNIMGFHHSWLGNWQMIYDKINAYAHSTNDHVDNLSKNGKYDVSVIREYVEQGKSLFPNARLLRNDSIKLLQSVEEMRISHPELFFK